MDTNQELTNEIMELLIAKGLIDPQNYTIEEVKLLLSELLIGFSRRLKVIK